MTDRMDSGICHFHIIHNAFQKEYSRYNLISRWKLWGIFIFYFIFFRICAQNKDRLIWQPPHFLLNSVWERKTVAEESKSTGDSKTILYCIVLPWFVLFWELVMIIPLVYYPVWKFSGASVVVFTVWGPEFSVDSESICFCKSDSPWHLKPGSTWHFFEQPSPSKRFPSSQSSVLWGKDSDAKSYSYEICGSSLAMLQNMKDNKYSKIWNIL